MPANAGIQVTDSVRHTVEKRYPGDDKAGMTEKETRRGQGERRESGDQFPAVAR